LENCDNMKRPTYKIKFTNISFKDIENLDNKTRKHILSKIIKLSKSLYDFRKDVKKLKGLGKNIYRFRIGDFRVIYTLSSFELVVLRIIDRKDLLKIINSLKDR
jgi:mRNA-degrading endonuclease RelE of RelBE toxin-antitoxin system